MEGLFLEGEVFIEFNHSRSYNGSHGNAWPESLGGKIHLNPNSDFWRRNLGAWDCTSDVDGRMCACIAVASLVLHEALHVCGRELLDWVPFYEGGHCNFNDVLANMFIWALGQRYDVTREGWCCKGFDNDGTFTEPNITASAFPAEDCCPRRIDFIRDALYNEGPPIG